MTSPAMPCIAPARMRGGETERLIRRACMAAQTNFIDIATIWLHAGKGGEAR